MTYYSLIHDILVTALVDKLSILSFNNIQINILISIFSIILQGLMADCFVQNFLIPLYVQLV